ncbi:MAG: acyl-CoA dehydrogenase [Cytophagales bacterium]|nr:MAG: acyl-CoA dehydrogenase [Cytophagales bacterium]TAF59335.1 MAG: acyl-CoA dehydrogenase [Cytophagales bacterium]
MTPYSNKTLKGGAFLIQENSPEDIFIPEEFGEEENMMRQSCKDFVSKEIDPIRDRIDKLEPGLMNDVLSKAGELGFLGVSVPEVYGGLGLSFNCSMLIADALGATGSFATAYGAHTGIGTLPILYYGTDAQKQKYVPKLASGEWKACYCLTEPDAGSDANSGKTKAVLSADGQHYLLTGQKMWISNAGFAQLLIVFARIENDKNLTAFIVERSYEGITMNEEEHKMGIKGSSTRQVFFNECPVPVENMLSERGNGFKIAVNILNIGRIKLAVAALGGARDTCSTAIRYANERKQFNQKISSFPAIQHKIAEMATKLYATESACYRAGQDIDRLTSSLVQQGLSESQAKLKSAEQFAVECAITKVHSSEVLDYCVDEGVQIFGGMGFSADAPMERAYRDARISRIYEGTNEINRMLLVGMLVKRGMKGELDLMGPAMAVGKELLGVPDFNRPDLSQPLAEEKILIKNLKKAILMIAGKAVQSLGANFEDEQELLMTLADLIIECYVCESVCLRTEKLISLRGKDATKGHYAMTQLYVRKALDLAAMQGKEAICAFAKGDEMNVLLLGLKRFTKYAPLNNKEIRRSIAQMLIDNNGYCF